MWLSLETATHSFNFMTITVYCNNFYLIITKQFMMSCNEGIIFPCETYSTFCLLMRNKSIMSIITTKIFRGDKLSSLFYCTKQTSKDYQHNHNFCNYGRLRSAKEFRTILARSQQNSKSWKCTSAFLGPGDLDLWPLSVKLNLTSEVKMPNQNAKIHVCMSIR